MWKKSVQFSFHVLCLICKRFVKLSPVTWSRNHLFLFVHNTQTFFLNFTINCFLLSFQHWLRRHFVFISRSYISGDSCTFDVTDRLNATMLTVWARKCGMMTGDWWRTYTIVDWNWRGCSGRWRKMLYHLTNGRIVSAFATAVRGCWRGRGALWPGTTWTEAKGARKRGLKNKKNIYLRKIDQ